MFQKIKKMKKLIFIIGIIIPIFITGCNSKSADNFGKKAAKIQCQINGLSEKDLNDESVKKEFQGLIKEAMTIQVEYEKELEKIKDSNKANQFKSDFDNSYRETMKDCK